MGEKKGGKLDRGVDGKKTKEKKRRKLKRSHPLEEGGGHKKF